MSLEGYVSGNEREDISVRYALAFIVKWSSHITADKTTKELGDDLIQVLNAKADSLLGSLRTEIDGATTGALEEVRAIIERIGASG